MDLYRMCPKVNKCSAMICPLDGIWKSRTHIKGEPVCALLLTYMKYNGLDIIIQYLPYPSLAKLIVLRYKNILARWGAIKRACRIASISPAKLGTRPSQF